MLPPTSLFERLPKDARAALEAAASTRTLAAGDALLSEGEDSTDLFVVLSGRVEIVKRSGRGEHRIDELGPGEPVGPRALRTCGPELD